MMKRLMIAALLALLAPAQASAQIEWPTLFDSTATRTAGMRVQVFDPEVMVVDTTIDAFTLAVSVDTTHGAYVTISLRDLLRDLVTFDDGLTRYVALKPYDENSPTRPTFTEADFLAGTEVSGQLTGAPFPTLSDTTATAAWYAVAVPETTGLHYLDFGRSNSRNRVSTLAELVTGTIAIDGVAGYQVWGGFRAQTIVVFAAGWYMFFDATARIPE